MGSFIFIHHPHFKGQLRGKPSLQEVVEPLRLSLVSSFRWDTSSGEFVLSKKMAITYYPPLAALVIVPKKSVIEGENELLEKKPCMALLIRSWSLDSCHFTFNHSSHNKFEDRGLSF